MITFDVFASHVAKLPDATSQRFARSLREWSSVPAGAAPPRAWGGTMIDYQLATSASFWKSRDALDGREKEAVADAIEKLQKGLPGVKVHKLEASSYVSFYVGPHRGGHGSGYRYRYGRRRGHRKRGSRPKPALRPACAICPRTRSFESWIFWITYGCGAELVGGGPDYARKTAACFSM